MQPIEEMRPAECEDCGFPIDASVYVVCDTCRAGRTSDNPRIKACCTALAGVDDPAAELLRLRTENATLKAECEELKIERQRLQDRIDSQ